MFFKAQYHVSHVLPNITKKHNCASQYQTRVHSHLHCKESARKIILYPMHHQIKNPYFHAESVFPNDQCTEDHTPTYITSS
jgi:hypothetical protein